MYKHKQLIFRILLTLAAALLVICLYPRKSQSQFFYKEGEIWNYADLRAEYPVPVPVDPAKIAAIEDTVREQTGPVYIYTAADNAKLSQYLREVESPKLQRHIRSQWNDIYNNEKDREKNREKIVLDPSSIDVERIVIRYTSAGKKDRRVSREDLINPETVVENIRFNIGRDDTETLAKLDSLDLTGTLFTPNVRFDKAATDKAYADGMKSDKYVKILTPDTIKEGELIIARGNKVNHQDFRKLQAYEAAVKAHEAEDTRASFLIVIGQVMYVLLVFAMLFIYLMGFEKRIYNNMRWLIFVLLLQVLFFVMAVAINPLWGYQGVYLVPMCIVPILVLVFFDARTAMFSMLTLTLLCAAITQYPLEFIFIQMIAGAAAVYSLGQLSRRSQLLRTALIVGATYIVAYASLELMYNGSFGSMSGVMLGLLAANAVLTSFAYILVFVCEKAFGFTSVVTLVELTDINHPVLRELSDRCPGTFQHSMAVSNLAADAALKVGADVTLIRCGALYHDIGKISNPAFFTENQGGVSPHSSLPPQTSAEIIISHVYEGLRRAEKAKLPRVIKDFIREHHGAGKAKYFYFTYCKEHPGEEVDPTPFTYPGPNPQTIETSILMMADSVEAASRSLKEYTPESISSLVNKIIDGQIADGLHNESPLSFRDVKLIKEQFIKRLKTMYHARIAYPDDPNKKN